MTTLKNYIRKGKALGLLKGLWKQQVSNIHTYCLMPDTHAGIKKNVLYRILKEANSREFVTPTSQHDKKRKTVVVNSFDKEALWRNIYEIYECKDHITPRKLLVLWLTTFPL